MAFARLKICQHHDEESAGWDTYLAEHLTRGPFSGNGTVFEVVAVNGIKNYGESGTGHPCEQKSVSLVSTLRNNPVSTCTQKNSPCPRGEKGTGTVAHRRNHRHPERLGSTPGSHSLNEGDRAKRMNNIWMESSNERTQSFAPP
jgi:hypothetical protein